MTTIDAMRPRLRCYTDHSCWMQDTGDPGDQACPARRCQLWIEYDMDPDMELIDVLTPPEPGEVVH